MQLPHSILRRLFLAAILGLATSLLIAGPLAVCLERFGIGGPNRGRDYSESGTQNRLTLEDPPVLCVLERGVLIDEATVTVFGVAPIYGTNPPVRPLPSWARAPALLARLERSVETRAYGWPLRCLSLESSEVVMQQPREIIDEERHSLRFSNARHARLPLRPLWPGLTLNTTLFAACWLIGLTIFAYALRLNRTRRGQCPACTYDLRSTPQDVPCPECGHPR